MNHLTASKMWSFGDDKPQDVPKVRSDSPNGPTTQAVLRSANIVNNGILSSADSPGKVSAGSAAVLASTGGDDGSTGGGGCFAGRGSSRN